MTVDKAALRALADTLNGILLPEGYNRQALKDAAVALPALLAENDALRAELQARQWLPIETAPVGNNPAGAIWCLLAYGPAHDQSISYGFRWHDKWYAASTFYRLGQERQYELRETEVHPTHWMPRPELPDDLPPAPPQGDGA